MILCKSEVLPPCSIFSSSHRQSVLLHHLRSISPPSATSDFTSSVVVSSLLLRSSLLSLRAPLQPSFLLRSVLLHCSPRISSLFPLVLLLLHSSSTTLLHSPPRLLRLSQLVSSIANQTQPPSVIQISGAPFKSHLHHTQSPLLQIRLLLRDSVSSPLHHPSSAPPLQLCSATPECPFVFKSPPSEFQPKLHRVSSDSTTTLPLSFNSRLAPPSSPEAEALTTVSLTGIGGHHRRDEDPTKTKSRLRVFISTIHVLPRGQTKPKSIWLTSLNQD